MQLIEGCLVTEQVLICCCHNLQAYLEELGAFDLLRCCVLDIPEVMDDGRDTSEEE